ncbi:MAG: hypothetical protein JXQ90_11265 [Cyclobacteriaceae bacterium]
MKPLKNIFFLTLTSLGLIGCELTLESEEIVYANDFENEDLNLINGGRVLDFDGSNVIGNYNNDGFDLTLSDLPDHNHVKISFDLLIHDSWNGNQQGKGGPDIWYFHLVVNDKPIFRNSFTTTFSNTGCGSQYCLLQSYPKEYPFSHDPKSGVSNFKPGLCLHSDEQDGTSVYRISKIFQHRKNNLLVVFGDSLVQTNSNSPICDESWSLDNLVIETLQYK